jgi:enoyl-CoA hydratase/carnithine racemase
MAATMAEPRTGARGLAGFAASHVILYVDSGIAEITFNRPERKNPLTFESYRELVAIFRAAKDDSAVKVFILEAPEAIFLLAAMCTRLSRPCST